MYICFQTYLAIKNNLNYYAFNTYTSVLLELNQSKLLFQSKFWRERLKLQKLDQLI